MKTAVYLSLFLLFTAFQCEDDQQPSVQHSDSNQILSGEAADLANDPFMLKSARIAGENLEIEVQYSGGCEAHEFTLVYPEVITLQYPPNFGMELYHNGNGDNCEAFLTETVVFDLRRNPMNMSISDLKAATLFIGNASDRDQSVAVE